MGLLTRVAAGPFQCELADQVVEVGAGEPELAGGLRHVPVVVLQALEHIATLKALRRVLKRHRGVGGRRIPTRSRKEMVLVERARLFSVSENDRPFDGMGELADV